MQNLDLVIQGTKEKNLVFEVRRILNGALTGRDQAAVRKHLEEGIKLGLVPPKEIPSFIPKLSDRITTANKIEVLRDETTSGEAEFVLLFDKDTVYVGVGSDHTDRKLERHSLVGSKQIYPNVISKSVWLYEDLKDHWDSLILRAWVKREKQKELYQEARLAVIMRPEDLIERVKLCTDGNLVGTVMYGGTVPTVSKEIYFSSYFETELIDEKNQRSITCSYTIEPMIYFKGEIT